MHIVDMYASCNHNQVSLSLCGRTANTFRRPSLLMKSISSSQCLSLVYAAWSWFGDRTIPLQFNTRQITTMDIVVGHAGKLLLTVVLARSPKYVASHLLPHLPFFLSSPDSLPDLFRNISTHCRHIHSPLSNISTHNQVLTLSKKSTTAVSQCRGPSLFCFNLFCPQIMD